MPKISIIIPVYDVEKYLRRCLDSVKNQTFSDWEAICVNDGSPDNSAKILNEYAKKDKRFKILTKENGGLSDARNFGMKVAKGDYILFLDSDDFIHPETLEITYFMAQRDKPDIVSFTYDRLYRPHLMVRYELGLNTNNVIPRGIKRKYKLQKIKSVITDDIYKYATEKTHNIFNPRRKWLIKHCQVWKNLYRHELIKNIPFIKGILFEDFPWWSQVLLKNPKTTIINLPFYYYTPNFRGIIYSAKQLKILQSLCKGINFAYALYKKKATNYQMKMWSKNFLWYFINWAFRKIKYLKTKKDLETARRCFIQLKKIGALENPPNAKFKKLCAKIYGFIDKK